MNNKVENSRHVKGKKQQNLYAKVQVIDTSNKLRRNDLTV